MTALAVLIVCYSLVVLVGKYSRKQNYLGYIFVAIFTVVQVAFMLFYLFSMEVPTP